MGVNDGVFVYDPLAEIQLRGTDRLHCANEYEKPDSIRKKARTTRDSSGGITSRGTSQVGTPEE